MTVSRFVMMMGLLVLGTGAGCCSWCQKHCCPQAPPPPAYAPVPAYAPAPQNCVPCVPCCPQTGVKPVPIVPGYGAQYGSPGWSKDYANCSCQ